MVKSVCSVLISLWLLSCLNPMSKDPVQNGGNDKTFTVTFDSQGGSPPIPPTKTVTLGSPYGTLPTVTRSGYTFEGWWTATDDSGSQIHPTTMVTIAADHTLYAKWEAAQGAQWARTTLQGTDCSIFTSVAIDSSGNVYAAGSQKGTGPYTYGPGISIAGTSSDYNVVLVKYNSSGTAQWAKALGGGTNESEFLSVSVDSSGYVYAAGYQVGTGTYTYGPNVTAAGSSYGENVVLVKYDSTGTALWARTVSSGISDSKFNGVAIDSFGNVYAAGYQTGTTGHTYGLEVSAVGTSSSNNVVLVKYWP